MGGNYTPVLSLQVLKEAKVLLWAFVMLNIPEVAYFVYLMYRVSREQIQSISGYFDVYLDCLFGATSYSS